MSGPIIAVDNADLVLSQTERDLIKNYRLTSEHSQETLASLARRFAVRDGAEVLRAAKPSLKLVSGGAA